MTVGDRVALERAQLIANLPKRAVGEVIEDFGNGLLAVRFVAHTTIVCERSNFRVAQHRDIVNDSRRREAWI